MPNCCCGTSSSCILKLKYKCLRKYLKYQKWLPPILCSKKTTAVLWVSEETAAQHHLLWSWSQHSPQGHVHPELLDWGWNVYPSTFTQEYYALLLLHCAGADRAAVLLCDYWVCVVSVWSDAVLQPLHTRKGDAPGSSAELQTLGYFKAFIQLSGKCVNESAGSGVAD